METQNTSDLDLFEASYRICCVLIFYNKRIEETVFHSKTSRRSGRGRLREEQRSDETIETLQERSDEAAQCEPSGKRAPATQSKSGSFSNLLIINLLLI